jgi:acyl-CoA hydrolase
LAPVISMTSCTSMTPEMRARINMTRISFINQLYGHEPLARLQRRHTSFVNTCMMMTLLGAAVSDGLDSGKLVSGIGGQYNFVVQGHALPDARSILMLRATRQANGQLPPILCGITRTTPFPATCATSW